MKKYLILITIALHLFSCELENTALPFSANDALTRSSDSEPNLPYTFDKVTNPVNWSSYNNLEEMLNACQMPQEILESISTDNLIKSLMNHPLFFIYSAYNNELDGVKVVLDNFNGFTELQKREDVADKILNFYSESNVRTLIESTKNFRNHKEYIIYHLDFLELIITTKQIPTLFNQQNIERLEKIMHEKYEAKLSHLNNISLFSIKKSLLLGAEIKLSKNYLSTEDQLLLREFIKVGGNFSDEKIYTKISKIIILR